MKKVLISILFSLVTICTFGQDYCMYNFEEKVCHEISETKILLKSITLKENEIINMIQRLSSDNLKSIYNLGDGLFLIEMKNSTKESLLNLRKQLNALEEIIFTSPIFFSYTGYSNEIVVRLNSMDDYPILLEMAELYSSIVSKNDNALDRVYLLTLPHNSDKDAAEISLELYETGLFEFAHACHIDLWAIEGLSGNMNDFTDRTIEIYPNPVSSILYISLDRTALFQNKTHFYDILLFDNLGKVQRRIKGTDGIVEMNVSNIPNGIYHLSIYNGNSSKPESYKIYIKH